MIFSLLAALASLTAAVLTASHIAPITSGGTLYSVLPIILVITVMSFFFIKRRGVAFLLAALISGLSLTLWASPLQIAAFTVMAGFLGICLFVIQPAIDPNFSVRKNLSELFAAHYLLRLWLAYRIRARYEQLILGITWAALLPLLESGVLAFALTYLIGDGNQSSQIQLVLLILSGRVIYYLFQSSILRGRAATGSLSGILKQVYFPREISVLLGTGEALIDFGFALLPLLILTELFGNGISLYLPLIILPMALMLILGVGIGMILAWFNLIIRDLDQLTRVILFLLFYVTVLFDSRSAPLPIQILMPLNPINAAAEMFRGIILYNTPPDPALLFIAATINLILLYVGYTIFKVNEDRFVEYL